MILGRILRRLAARIGGARGGWPKLLFALALLVALPAMAYSRGFGLESSEVGTNSSEMVVERLEPTQNKINLVLKEKSGARRLVLAVGQTEAVSIFQDLNTASKMDQPVTAYAMTRSITDALGGKVQRVVVNNFNDTTFFAKVVVAMDNREVAVDAAPSDAIALALRSKAPIFADMALLERHGILPGR